jgi:predicted tellurium resistance membrane protein TerC
MVELFTLENLFTLGMLVFLQAVLGFDNLLYISIESKRVPEADQQRVRRIGIGLAILLRIVLLFVVVQAIALFQQPWFGIHFAGIIEGEFNVHSLIVLAGGGFIVHTALKEISHMLSIDHLDGHGAGDNQRTVGSAIAMIVLMNLVFSFDSILSALALTQVFVVMATAIVVSGVMMMVLADRVADFLQKNRMYEVLGLFILLIVGVMLLSEGGHLSHLHLAGYPVEAMSKTTFYFSISVLVLVDIAQSRFQKKLGMQRAGGQPHDG